MTMDVVNKIKSWMKGKDNPSPADLENTCLDHLGRTMCHRIMNFEPGKLFKGHAGGLHQVGEDTLELVNCYWTNVVVQSFNINENTTERKYYMNAGENPKYVRDIMKNAKHDHYKFILNDNIEIDLYDWSLQITKKTKLKGLNFKNHWDNINDLKKLRNYVRGIKHNLKNNPEILECNGELNENSCYVIKGFKKL